MQKVLGSVVVAVLISACADRPMSPSEPQELSSIADVGAFARVGPPGPCCYEDGRVLRTVAPPSAFPNEGRDPIYAFMAGGAPGQLAVVSFGPGTGNYHGGAWAVNSVTWNVTPYLITSDEQLFEAAADGDVTITRLPAADFRCPLQP